MSPIKLIFVQPDGTEQILDVCDSGITLMQAARRGNVPGIPADCGGYCSCATCHVHVDPAWIDVVGRASGVEAEIIDLSPELSDNSRLACQIGLRPELDGLRVVVVGNG